MKTRRRDAGTLGVACVLAACLTVGLAGCGRPDGEVPPSQPSTSLPSITLNVQLEDDPELSQALELLKGEWKEQSGGEFVTKEVGRQELLEGNEADLVIFSPLMLGELCEKQRLRPVRESALRDDALRYKDLYPAVREHLLVYGSQTMALPIGCPAPVLAFNPEEGLPEAPVVWQDNAGVAPAAVSSHGDEFEQALVLLTRALTYIEGDVGTALFEPSTMHPRIASPAFVRALEELRKGARGSLPAHSKAVRSTLPGPGERPRVVWPLRPWSELKQAASKGVRISVLPGSRERYDSLSMQWKQFDDVRRVTVLGSSGRLVAVTANSRNATQAFKLASWLAGHQNARQLAVSSTSCANVRRSMAALPDDWTNTASRTLGRQFATAQAKALSLPIRFVFPRIVKSEKYLESLGTAVCTHCARGEADDKKLLESVAAKWESLTEEIGRDRQIQACQRHLGLLPYEPQTR